MLHGLHGVSRVAGGVLFLGVGVGGLETSARVTDEYSGSAAQWWGSPRVPWGLDATKWSRHASVCAEAPSFLSLATDAPSLRAFSPLHPDPWPFSSQKAGPRPTYTPACRKKRVGPHTLCSAWRLSIMHPQVEPLVPVKMEMLWEKGREEMHSLGLAVLCRQCKHAQERRIQLLQN